MVQRLGGRWPPVWVLLEQPAQEVLRGSGHELRQAGEVDVLARDLLHRLLGTRDLRLEVAAAGVGRVGQAACEQQERHDARGVHVRLRAVLLAHNLWGQEQGGASDGGEWAVIRAVLHSEPKVRGLHPPGRRLVRKQEVDRLHIAVHDPLGGALRQEAQHGAHDVCHVLLRVRGGLPGLQQRPALAELHDDVHVLVVLKHFLESCRVQGRPQLAHRVDFRADAQQVVRRDLPRARLPLGHALAGVLHAVFLQCGAVHVRKAALPDFLHDGVPVAQVPGVVEAVCGVLDVDVSPWVLLQ
mmetsp:Transcript_17855/g.46491  ORF Transcript_17855/g.46491 Transcript_17855/m.46491 type:complete len:298 (+) Transcript_17855:876-1769(+)